MKPAWLKWKILVPCFLILGGAWYSFAGGKTDPLNVKLEAVSKELFGTPDAWMVSGSGKGRVTGLFSPSASTGEVPTVALERNAAYEHALISIQELKTLIEEESEKRAPLDYSSEKYQTLVEVSAKYVEIQKALYLNFIGNIHERGLSPRSFDIDSLTLKVDAGVGGQLMLMTELQKKYSVRHLPGDTELSKVELFLPPYERMQIEIAGLSKVKSKVEYQKLIHLMHLRDSLVNRWSIMRLFSSPHGTEGAAFPPRHYAAFAEDVISKPSDFLFSKDLGVEDRYQVAIVDSLDGLIEVLQDQPLGGPAEYRKLVRDFYAAFNELKGLQIDAEAVVANLYHVEETALLHSAKQIVLESNFPEDDLGTTRIAERISLNAFRVRKAALLTTLLKRIKTDLATVRGYLEPDENGMVDAAAVDHAQDYIKLASPELKRAEKALDPYFNSISAKWRQKSQALIAGYYAKALPGGEATAARSRYAEFFNRMLESSLDGVSGVKQIRAYEQVKAKLDRVSSSTAESLRQSSVPLSERCTAAGMGMMVCETWINSDLYLSRLDAAADLGMARMNPWTPAQISFLFSKKIETIEKHDGDAWKLIEAAVKDEGQMKRVANFLEALNQKHQEAISKRQEEYSRKLQDLSVSLARDLTRNPDLDLKSSQTYGKIRELQQRIQDVGQTPEESVLTEQMYQAAASQVFSSYLTQLSYVPPTPKPEKPAPAPKDPRREFLRIETPVAVRDATYVKPPVNPLLTVGYPSKSQRAKKMAELGKLFSLLGFGDELFNQYKNAPALVDASRKPVPFVNVQPLIRKPDAGESSKIGYAIRAGQRSGKVSALSEIARSGAGQKLLAEAVMADVYTRNPFLRIQAGEDENSPTGLERLAGAYNLKSGWNREAAGKVFTSLLQTAITNDRNKVEEAVYANPTLPVQDANFKKIFRAQAHNRSLFISSQSGAKAGNLEHWDEQLKKETRTTAEKWSDGLSRVASYVFLASMIFLLWEFLPLLIPAVGAVIPSASAFFASFSVLGMSGSVIAGFLSGSNLLVQLFFLATVVAQGQVAFFTLPAQLQYQKELANSTVGLTGKTQRILAPSERVSRENIQKLQEEIHSAKLVTGVMAVVQVAFLPLQVKQLARGFGVSGKVALSRFGEASPGLVQSMKPYSLSELIAKHGYAKGSRMYFQRYTTAILENKPVPAVNGGAVVGQAQELLVNSLGTHLSNSSELASLFEARLNFLKEKVLSLREQSRRYFGVTQRVKTKDLDQAVKMFFGKELATLGFHMSHPEVKIAIRAKVAQAMEEGMFSEIEYGSEKYLLKSFLLRIKAEKFMHEAIFLKRSLDQLRSLELMAGGPVGTREVLSEFTRLDQFDTLDGLLRWASRNPEYQGTPFAEALDRARRATKDFKIIVDDINRLTPRERAAYQAMQGEADVIVNDDLTLKLGTGEKADPSQDEMLLLPGLSLGLEP